MRPCKHILLQGRGDHARGPRRRGVEEREGGISEFTSQDATCSMPIPHSSALALRGDGERFGSRDYRGRSGEGRHSGL